MHCRKEEFKGWQALEQLTVVVGLQRLTRDGRGARACSPSSEKSKPATPLRMYKPRVWVWLL